MAANSFQKEGETPEFVTVAELADNLVYKLPKCDNFTIRRALREAYGEFCRLSNALVTSRQISLENGETVYPVANMVPDCRVECVRKIQMRHRVLREGYDYTVMTGTPPALCVDEYLLPKVENEERVLEVECLEMPNSGSERVPRWFIKRYGDAICAGALVRLFAMTGKPWTDAAQARMELGRWDGYVATARLGSMSGSPFGNGRFDTVDMSEVL